MTVLGALDRKRFLVGSSHLAVRGISLSTECRSRREVPMDGPEKAASHAVEPPPLIDGHALGDLLDQHRPWSRVPAVVPPVCALVAWSLTFCDAAVTAWLAAVQCGSFGCTGRLCEVTTLSGHPVLTLALSAGSLLSLIVLSCVTRAFTIGTAPALFTLAASSLVAAIAVAGAVALALVALLVVVIAVLLFAVFLGG
jgi:hypothetical protein